MMTKVLIVSTAATVLLCAGTVRAYRWVSDRITVHAKGLPVLVAGRYLEIGSLIKDTDLTVAEKLGTFPAGVLLNKEDLVGRGVIVAIENGELIVESRLAPPGRNLCRLSAVPLIKKDMRAIAIRLDNSKVLEAFIIPPNHVDILMSGRRSGNRGADEKMLFQDIEVFSAGQNIEKDAKGKPMVVNLINVLVSKEQAEEVEAFPRNAGTRFKFISRGPIDPKLRRELSEEGR
jgi:pilus assembly protein CpaB